MTHVGNIPMFAAIALQPFLFNSSFENHSFVRKCGPKALRGLACIYTCIYAYIYMYLRLGVNTYIYINKYGHSKYT